MVVHFTNDKGELAEIDPSTPSGAALARFIRREVRAVLAPRFRTIGEQQRAVQDIVRTLARVSEVLLLDGADIGEDDDKSRDAREAREDQAALDDAKLLRSPEAAEAEAAIRAELEMTLRGPR